MKGGNYYDWSFKGINYYNALSVKKKWIKLKVNFVAVLMKLAFFYSAFCEIGFK